MNREPKGEFIVCKNAEDPTVLANRCWEEKKGGAGYCEAYW